MTLRPPGCDPFFRHDFIHSLFAAWQAADVLNKLSVPFNELFLFMWDESDREHWRVSNYAGIEVAAIGNWVGVKQESRHEISLPTVMFFCHQRLLKMFISLSFCSECAGSPFCSHKKGRWTASRFFFCTTIQVHVWPYFIVSA